jgi:hypothetical protein
MLLEFWIILWKTVFVVGVGLFAALAVVVAIGGARDIAKLLHALRTQRIDDRQESDY